MLDGLHVDAGWAAAIGGALLRRGDPLGLALAAQVGLKLGKDAEHVEERLAGSGRGVHGLFGGGEMGALVFECRDNDLKITHRARQAVDARDHQRLAGMDELKDGPELGPSREGGAVAGLGADHGAPCGLKRRRLGIEVLVRGRDPGIADAGG